MSTFAPCAAKMSGPQRVFVDSICFKVSFVRGHSQGREDACFKMPSPQRAFVDSIVVCDILFFMKLVLLMDIPWGEDACLD